MRKPRIYNIFLLLLCVAIALSLILSLWLRGRTEQQEKTKAPFIEQHQAISEVTAEAAANPTFDSLMNLFHLLCDFSGAIDHLIWMENGFTDEKEVGFDVPTVIRPCDNLVGYLHEVMAEWHESGVLLPEAQDHLAHISTILREEAEMDGAWGRIAEECAYFLEFYNRQSFFENS